MEEPHRLEQAIFRPGRGRAWISYIILSLVGLVTGVVSVTAFAVIAEYPDQKGIYMFVIGFGLPSLACWVVLFRHFFFSHRLKICLAAHQLSIADYFSNKTVELTKVTDVYESMDKDVIVIQSGSGKLYAYNHHFANDDEKEKFLRLLNGYCNIRRDS
jgi:hypothetical protein